MTFRSLSPPQRAPPSRYIDKDHHCSVRILGTADDARYPFSFNLPIQKHLGLKALSVHDCKSQSPSSSVDSRAVSSSSSFYRSLLLLLNRTIIHGTQMHPIETKHSISLKPKTHRTTTGTARWLLSCLTVSSERKAAECQQL